MKKDEIVDQFAEFLRENYYKDLALAISEGKKSLEVDFSLLDRFSPVLVDTILEKPEETLPLLEKSVEQIDLPQKGKVHIRFFNPPESSQIRIRNIRAEHIGKLLTVDGVVKRASEVRPEISEIVFECQECGNRITVVQTEKDKTVKYPTRCDCGNRRGFRVVKEKLYDARWISIEEPFEITTGERPSNIMVYLKEDLVSPKMRNKTEPGNRIKVIGILKEVPKRTVRGKKTRQMEILLDANNVEAVETEWEELVITPEDERMIKKFARDKKIYDKLVASLAPTMYGLDKIKLAIILQLFGGVPHLLKDGTRIRGDIHLLLIGDPATGKSVHGDTYIALQDGSIKKIRDIVEQGLSNGQINRMNDGYFTFTNHDVFSMNSNYKIVPSKATILWKRKSPEYLYEVETRRGTKIKVTPSHLFFTKLNGRVVAKKAESLIINDYIATTKNNSDVFWDKIIKVKKVKTDSDYVYDLQVDPYHNFVANNVIVHNSQILKLASEMIPRGRYVSGKGTTAAGLTASVVKDVEFLGGWVLEAGALVLSNNSIACIDEFEKMDKMDQIAMHEALSLQQVSIAKASIVATLPARTSVLAGANPKLGRFDPYIPIREQIDVPETLLSRFDVKFALRDLPNAELDEKIVDHVLRARHFEPEEVKPPISPEFLRKYIAYARVNCKPVLTKEAGKRLKEFYVGLRAKTSGEEAPVPITLRQYEALIRLAEASARVRLSPKVLEEDADRAIEIMKHSLRQFGFDPETGMIDIDRVEGVTTSAQRSKIRIVLDILEELHNAIGKTIPVDEIIKRGKEEGVDDVEDILKRMKREGMIFEPRPNFIQKV